MRLGLALLIMLFSDMDHLDTCWVFVLVFLKWLDD